LALPWSHPPASDVSPHLRIELPDDADGPQLEYKHSNANCHEEEVSQPLAHADSNLPAVPQAAPHRPCQQDPLRLLETAYHWRIGPPHRATARLSVS
jgi:hypothetical protein